jgi:hypothetical protein
MLDLPASAAAKTDNGKFGMRNMEKFSELWSWRILR